ncbi:hypothetical protein GCM10027346_28220 [Hymenobacter seoulensis]
MLFRYASAILLGTLLTATFSSAQAQDAPPTPAAHRPALFRLGAGSSRNGTGDYPVFKGFVEYAPQFGQHVRLGSRLAYIGGNQPYYLDAGIELAVPQSYRALNLEQEAFWVPFGVNKVVEFGIGGGLVAGYSKQETFTSAGYNSQSGAYYYETAIEEGFHLGYMASLYADLALTQDRTWRIGGRLAVQNDTRGNILPGAQLQLSRAW